MAATDEGSGASSSSASEVIGDSSSKLFDLVDPLAADDEELEDLVPRPENLLVKDDRAPPAVRSSDSAWRASLYEAYTSQDGLPC